MLTVLLFPTARAELPLVVAELTSTRKLLDQMGKEAAERFAVGKEQGSLKVGRSPGRSPKAGSGVAAGVR